MSKLKNGIIGHAIGDAMGVPVEFKTREEMLKSPLTTMIEDTYQNLPAGTYSDDTAMTLATLDSIINKKKIDCKDIMNNFYLWLRDAKYTATGVVFDAGRTCIQSIINYSKGYDIEECGQKDITSNGNGSLMRILPIAYYCFYKKCSDKKIYEIVKNVSSLTHAHEISILGCYIYVRFVIYLLEGKDKFKSYNLIKEIEYKEFSNESIDKYKRILKENIADLELNEIKSSGYVVDTLEASFWVLLKSKDYKEAIIGAVNLGEDTDTIAAITGSMAGIIYSYDSIPKEWLNKLARKKYIEELCNLFEQTIN